MQARGAACCRQCWLHWLAASALVQPSLPLPAVVLNGIPEVSDTLLARLACCPQLLRLSLSNCSSVTDQGVAAIALVLPGLLELRLDECSKVGAGPSHILGLGYVALCHVLIYSHLPSVGR